MTRNSAVSARAPRSIAVAAAVALALVFSTMSGDLARQWLQLPAITAIPYARSALASTCDVLVMLLLLRLAMGRSSLALLWQALRKPWARPLRWAAWVFAPATLLALLLVDIAPGLGAVDFLWPGLGGPVFEELVYRILALSALMRWAGWRFWPACLLPSAFFALAHVWQGHGWMEVAGISAITAAGGVLFGWVFVRWDYNAWPPILLHVGMNCLWTLFAFGDTALGSGLGNGLRLLTVCLAVMVTLTLAPKPSASGQPD